MRRRQFITLLGGVGRGRSRRGRSSCPFCRKPDQLILGARIAVELGVEAADRFDLVG
jgi:hypothetical protein